MKGYCVFDVLNIASFSALKSITIYIPVSLPWPPKVFFLRLFYSVPMSVSLLIVNFCVCFHMFICCLGFYFIFDLKMVPFSCGYFLNDFAPFCLVEQLRIWARIYASVSC